MTELCDLGAVELRRNIGAKEISPVELLESCIARTEAVDPAVNAMVARDFERARKTAQGAERAVMAGEALGVLHGLPVGVKDLNAPQGLRSIGEKIIPSEAPRESVVPGGKVYRRLD